MNNSLKTSSTSHFAQQQADRLLRRLAIQIARAAQSAGDDEVHDLRVAIRRFNAVLKALNPCFPKGETARIRVALKRIMDLAGEVRNRDIGVELLSKTVGPAAAPLVVRFERERAAAANDLTVSLKFWVRTKTSARWHQALHQAIKPASEADNFCALPINITAMRMMPRIIGKHFKRGEDAAHGKTSAHKLHQFRIATKKFRYTLDLFAPLYRKSVADLVEELKGVQTLLGEINDYATVRDMVRRALKDLAWDMARDMTGEMAGDMAPHVESGREISAAIGQKQREKAGEFCAHWEAAFTSEKVVQWKAKLQQIGEQVGRPAVKSGSVSSL